VGVRRDRFVRLSDAAFQQQLINKRASMPGLSGSLDLVTICHSIGLWLSIASNPRGHMGLRCNELT
jgi:hypothetical protein